MMTLFVIILVLLVCVLIAEFLEGKK